MTPKILPAEIVAILQPRILDEYTAFYFYKHAANWCAGAGFKIAAEYFEKESSSELEHVAKLQAFLVDWNVLPKLPSIPPPPVIKSLVDIIDKAYMLEYDLYEKYEDDSVKVMKAGDVCAFDLLQFFRNTQTTSVAEYSDMKNMLEGVDANDKFKLLMLEENLFGDA